MIEIETFDSAGDAVANSPIEAANLRARAELMRQIANIVQENGWKQSTQPPTAI